MDDARRKGISFYPFPPLRSFSPARPVGRERRGSCEVNVRAAWGLSNRAVMDFVDCALGFESAIIVQFGCARIDGTSIVDLVSADIVAGSQLKLEAEGPDAREAVSTLANLVSASAAPADTNENRPNAAPEQKQVSSTGKWQSYPIYRFPKWLERESYTIAHEAASPGRFIVTLVRGSERFVGLGATITEAAKRAWEAKTRPGCGRAGG
jgi:catabolite repression HPr-like protein